MKTINTSLCAAISSEGVVGYQIFASGMHGEDFLGFMSNLVNAIKLERNTSLDEESQLDDDGQELVENSFQDG